MWRKRDKGEGIPTRSLHNKSLLSEFSLPPDHQQKTGLFRNTMIAPAPRKPCHRVAFPLSPDQLANCQGDKRTVPLSVYPSYFQLSSFCFPLPNYPTNQPQHNSRSRSLCGGKEIKARVSPPEYSIVKAFCQSLSFLLTTSRRPGFSGIQ